MLDFSKENYEIQLKKFHYDVWDKLLKTEKEKLLQWMIDYEAKQLGLPSLCKVRIGTLNGGGEKGRFNENKNLITIEKELAIDGLMPPFHERKKQHVCLDRNRETFKVLMHEFRHSVQLYVKSHPEKYQSSNFFKILRYNTEKGQHKSFNSYFTINYSNKKTLFVSNILYTIQPSERDAIMFQDKKMKEFDNIMHKLFPEKYPVWNENDSQLIGTVNDAIDRYQIDKPFEAIDTILMFLNGEDVEHELNEIMFRDVVETQQKPFFEKIKSQLLDKENMLINKEHTNNGNDYYDEYQNISDEAYDEIYR